MIEIRIDQILKPFLMNESSGGHAQWHIVGKAQFLPASRPGRRIRSESCRIDAVRHGLDPIGRGAKRNRALRQIVAARGNKAGTSERMSRGRPRRGEAFGDVYVGAMKADH